MSKITGKYRIYKKQLCDRTVYNLQLEKQWWFNIKYWVWFDFAENYRKNFDSSSDAKVALRYLIDSEKKLEKSVNLIEEGSI